MQTLNTAHTYQTTPVNSETLKKKKYWIQNVLCYLQSWAHTVRSSNLTCVDHLLSSSRLSVIAVFVIFFSFVQQQLYDWIILSFCYLHSVWVTEQQSQILCMCQHIWPIKLILTHCNTESKCSRHHRMHVSKLFRYWHQYCKCRRYCLKSGISTHDSQRINLIIRNLLAPKALCNLRGFLLHK